MDKLPVQPQATVGPNALERYRDTEIGPLPEDWKVAKLGEIIAAGPQNGLYKPHSSYGEGTLIVRIDSFGNEGGTIEQASSRLRLSPAEVQRYQLEANDILVNRVNSISHLGKSVLVGEFSEPVVFESNMMRLRLDANLVVHEYISRFLSSQASRAQIRGKAKRAVAQSSINQGDVKSINVPVPSLSEQQAVVTVLRTVEKAKETTEQIIKTSQELKRSLMNHLFTYGPVPVNEADKVPLKETEIGPLPEHWDLVRLGDVAQSRYGLGQPPRRADDGLPMIRATNIKKGRIVREGLVYVDHEAIPASRHPYLEVGDIIVVRSGAYTGDVAMITEEWEGAIAGYDLIISPSKEIDSAFCSQYLLGPRAQDYFRSQRDRSAQPHINSQQLCTTFIPMPELPEQIEVARILRVVQEKIEAERHRRRCLEALFRTLLHNLMTGKVRVKDTTLEQILETM